MPAPDTERDDTEELTTVNGVTLTYARIWEAMAGEPFEMVLKGKDFDCVVRAVNQGIDSRLQACFCPSRGDRQDGRKLTFSPESLPVLVRRLCEDDDEESQLLAQDILSVLGFNELGQWRKPED